MPHNQVFALVDCNNFFVSCERVFQPWLENAPVMVLSANDGCVISRSNEVKQLGIQMGVPFFQVRDQVREQGIEVRSANFELYSDMSRRIVQVLESFAPDIEPYSVDESFMDLGHIDPAYLTATGHDIRSRILGWTGVPSCVGIAPTKTLAKLANLAAKKMPHLYHGGVCNMMDEAVRERVLCSVSVSDIWGIGRRSAQKLQAMGVHTALDLRDMELHAARGILTVVGCRIVEELRGKSCLSLDLLPAHAKSIAVTRSFGRVVSGKSALKAALSGFSESAARKLRDQGLEAGYAQLYLKEKQNDGSVRTRTMAMALDQASDLGIDFVRVMHRALDVIYNDHQDVDCIKAGIILQNITEKQDHQTGLFENTFLRKKWGKLTAAMDKINREMGGNKHSVYATARNKKHSVYATAQNKKHSVYATAQNKKHSVYATAQHKMIRPLRSKFDPLWYPKSSYASPRFTTCLSDIPVLS